MATDINVVDLSFAANADLSAKQYYFVKFTADRKVDVCSGATDKPVGILQNKPAAANRTAVVRVVGASKLSFNGTVAAGDTVGTDSGGQGVKKTPGTDTTNYEVAQAVEAAAAGATAMVILGVPGRSA